MAKKKGWILYTVINFNFIFASLNFFGETSKVFLYSQTIQAWIFKVTFLHFILRVKRHGLCDGLHLTFLVGVVKSSMKYCCPKQKNRLQVLRP